ncbi:MAG: HlyC/CorC family transporter [Actinobacteria bacterium]|nr:HlyC/CorC family transporter [Actinomycetota bacterium]
MDPIISYFGSSEFLVTIVVVVLIAMSAFLSVAETALLRMTRSRAQSMIEDGKWGTRNLLQLTSHPDRFMNPLKLIVLSCLLVEAAVVGAVFERHHGVRGLVISSIVNVFVVYVLADAAPRLWALEHMETAAQLTATPVYVLVGLWPIRLLSNASIGVANILLPGRASTESQYVSEDEILALADAAVEEDVIQAEERELIEQIIEFGDTICREIMVPRPDMVTVDGDVTVNDALEVSLTAGRSRVPVCGEGIDDIIGVAYAKDLMRADRSGREHEVITRVMRRAHFVPETKRIAELLPEMQARKFHLAVVVDEYGGTAGIVTLEDVLEELVGEIVDEFDREDPMVLRLAGGALRVQARMPIDEVEDLLGARLPEGDWDTIGGLMFHLLGHVPINGEVADCGAFRLRAENVEGRRIGAVRIEVMAAAESTEEQSS